MTRLRFTLKDRDLARTNDIKAVNGVIDVVSNNVAYQIIIGTHVSEIHAQLISMLGLSGDAASPKGTKTRKNPVKAVLDLFSESMSPILEPIIAAGMLAGVLSLISLTGLISPESPTYIILDSLRSSVFYFLPVFMAMSCAKRLNASPYLAVALAAGLLSTSINGVEDLSLFGTVSFSALMEVTEPAIYACASGDLFQLSQIRDKAFSSGALGKGVGIIPNKNQITAPAAEEVICLFPTKHA